MRHLKRGRHLGRNASHRRAMFRNMTCSLIAHERIVTTVAKAKELRPIVERLITLAKRNSLHARRLVISRLGGKKEVPIPLDDGKEDVVKIVPKLFDVLVPRYADRPGGYTRIIKRSYRRLGDAGETAYIELLKEGESRADRRRAPQRPKVEDDRPKQEPTPTPPPAAEQPAAQETPPATESSSTPSS